MMCPYCGLGQVHVPWTAQTRTWRLRFDMVSDELRAVQAVGVCGACGEPQMVLLRWTPAAPSTGMLPRRTAMSNAASTCTAGRCSPEMSWARWDRAFRADCGDGPPSETVSLFVPCAACRAVMRVDGRFTPIRLDPAMRPSVRP